MLKLVKKMFAVFATSTLVLSQVALADSLFSDDTVQKFKNKTEALMIKYTKKVCFNKTIQVPKGESYKGIKPSDFNASDVTSGTDSYKGNANLFVVSFDDKGYRDSDEDHSGIRIRSGQCFSIQNVKVKLDSDWMSGGVFYEYDFYFSVKDSSSQERTILLRAQRDL